MVSFDGLRRRKNDILWKGILEEVFDDLMRFVFPGADRVFDLPRGFDFLEQELAEMYPEPEKKSNTKFVDKLVKLYQRDGSEEWVLCHIEVQGVKDREFSRRMFRYYARIFDRHERPVTAIAIFTGKDKLPALYFRRFAGTALMYEYNTLSIMDFEDRDLAANQNPFALVMLAAKKALLRGENLDDVLMNEKLDIARLLIKRGYSDKKTNAILSFLHNYVQFDNQESNRIFEERIDGLTGKADTMGIHELVGQLKIEEAKDEGRAEKEIAVVNNLIKATRFSDRKIADIAGVSEAFVRRARRKLK